MRIKVKKLIAAVLAVTMIVFAAPVLSNQSLSLFAEVNAADTTSYDYVVAVGEKFNVSVKEDIAIEWSVSDSAIIKLSNKTNIPEGDSVVSCCEVNPIKAGTATLYAKSSGGTVIKSWKIKVEEEKKAVVTFEPNGGYMTDKKVTVEPGKTTVLPTPEKNGYTCMGWAYDENATACDFKCGESFKPTSNVTLYAVWKANHMVRFNAGEGTVSVPVISVNVGNTCVLPTPVREGYYCKGWSKSENAATADYKCGEKYRPTDSVILYAVWTEQYKITFNAGSKGTVSPTEVLVTVGSTYNLPTATRNDYANIGWSTTKNATAKEFSCNQKYKPTADVTLYAVWAKANTLTGLHKVGNKWNYYKNGKIDKSFEGMTKNAYGWWYIKNGTIDYTYTGMAKNDFGWWYINKGKLDYSYTGMAQNKYGWWYMNKSKLDETYTGAAKGSSGWMYATKGKYDTSFTGMAKGSEGWMYFTKGKFDAKYTGMAKNAYGWWYMKNGKLDETYTGISFNAYGNWYIKKGKLDETYTGEFKAASGNVWKVVKGKATKIK